MSKINEYPQAVTINNNDLFVIDQESGGDHATKSASVSQIKQATRDGLTDNDISHYTGTPTAGTTAEAIGDLTTLTTTDKSSLVGAVNEVNGKTTFTKKTYSTTTALNIGANSIDTQTITINDAVLGIVVGFAITNNTDVVIMQVYFNGLTELNFRVRNVSSNAGTYKITVIYI